MENVELRTISPRNSHRSFTHDGQDPWATDDVSESFRYVEDDDEEDLIHHGPMGDKKELATPLNPKFAPASPGAAGGLGHARSPSGQAFLPASDKGSLLEEDSDNGPWWKRLRGWRFGAANCATAVIVVLLINLSLTLWVSKAKGYQDGRGVIYEGDCSEVRKDNVQLHLLINALSTILLSSSNYCMQCYSSPSRKELDRAHARGKYLEIGVMSFSNVFRISWKRSILWFCLALSSLPLHLFFNSVAYASISANNYAVIEVNEAFMQNTTSTNITMAETREMLEDDGFADLARRLYASKAATNASFTKLDNGDCINAYAQDFISDTSNLLVVIANQNSSSPPATNNTYNSQIRDRTSFGGDCQPDPYPWICSYPEDCGKKCPSLVGGVKSSPQSWAPFGNQVKECYAFKTDAKCKLEFSQTIIIVVMVFNVVKAVIMLYLVFMKETPLVTVGDAIQSYVSNPDPHTKYLCLYGKSELRRGVPAQPMAKQYHASRPFRIRAATIGRLLIFTIAFILAMVLCIFFLTYGISHVRGTPDTNTIFGLGLGAIDYRTMISWSVAPDDLVANVLIANLAQPVLSIIYFAYNSIWTTMALGREWNRYGFRRHGLRVSGRPRGAQRTTYFLQLPYRYALPVMALSGLLHWLVSQSIFLVAISRYDRDGNPITQYETEASNSLESEFLTCGYSPVAILCVILVGVVMIAVLLAQGFRRFDPGIPLAGTCSAAIAAACHLPASEDAAKARFRRLAWGVTGSNREMGHCAFSANLVEEPIVNNLYMGEKAVSK